MAFYFGVSNIVATFANIYKSLDMKKFYFIVALLVLSTITTSAADAEYITEQPQGTLFPNMSKSAHQYETTMGFLYDYDMDGVVADIVETDDALYVRDPLSLAIFGFSSKYWMKGEKAEGDTVVFKQQPILKYGNEAVYTAKLKMTVTTYWDEEWEMDIQEVSIDRTEDPSVKFLWKDNTLTLVDLAEDELFGIVMSDGYFGGVAEKNTVYTCIKATENDIPDGAVPEDWQVRFTNEEAQEDGALVKVIAHHNEIFIGGLPNTPKDSWIRGTIDGDKVVFPSNQYLGISPTSGCHATFTGAEVSITYDEAMNEYTVDVIPTDQVTFTYDAANKTMKSEDNMVINAGFMERPVYSVMSAPDMKIYSVTGVLTPSDPVITYYQPYGGDSWGIGVARFTISRFDAQGNYLDLEKMYYNVYFDEEKVEFYKDEYLLMKDGTTDVPCTYNDQYSIWYSGANYTINFYDGGFEKFGIQVFYTDGNETRSSKLVYYGESGIQDTVGEVSVVSVTYTDLMGRVINEPQHGIYIKTVAYSNGTNRVEKVVLK